MTNGQSSRAAPASGPAPNAHAPSGTHRHTAYRTRQTSPSRSRQTPAAADKPRHATRFHACKKCCMSHRPAAAPVSRRRGLPLLKPTAAPVNRHSSLPLLKQDVAQAGRRSSRAPPRSATQSDRCPTCCHPIRSLPRPAAARPLSTQKNAAPPTGRGIPGYRHRLPYSHSIVAGGLEEMS